MGEDNTLLFSCSYNYSNFDDQPLLDSSLLDNGHDDIMGISFFDEEFGEFIDEEDAKQEAIVDTSHKQEVRKIGEKIVEEKEPLGSIIGENSRKEKPKKMSTPSQMQPVKQEGGVALWVKWRGQWRACIQCYPNDLSTATARAMPTSSKKTYVVVFFPSSRTYSWVDLEFACHITESPEPLAQGTHEQGRQSVQDLDLPKQHMIRVLVANMLELSDRLPIKAVIESARNADAWKQFANEAVEAKEYCDLSRMLIKLFAMIQPSCFSESWIEESYNKWKNECEVADSAQAVEHLNKELVNAILWDELSALWDAPEQASAGSEWKRAVIENRNIYPSIPNDSLKRPRLDSPELNNKKAKIQVRRRYPTNFVKKEEPKVEEIPQQAPKPEEEEVSARSSSGGTKRPITNQQLCAAYIERKKRQCTRFPSQGSIYCCKHMSLGAENNEGVTKQISSGAENIEGVTKMEESPPEPAPTPVKSSNTIYPKLPGDKICEGMTKYGRRCTHRAKEDSLFCKKHSFADAPHLNPETGELISERPVEDGTDLKEQEEAAEPEEEAKDVQGQAEETPDDVKKDDNNVSEKNYSSLRRIGKILRSNSARIRCLGRCVNGEQCLHKSKSGSSFCDKHQPEGANISEEEEEEEEKEPPIEVNEAQNTRKAKTWLSRYMKTANEDDTMESDKLLEWLLSEASREEHVAEALLKLVTGHKERIENFLKLQQQKVMGSEVKEMISDKLDKTTCCICSKDFNEMAELGDHWKSEHTDQAQWFLKGYICKGCNKEFRNKSSFDRHSKSEHEGAEALAVCTECNEQFADFEALWGHVVTVHSDHLSASAIDLPMNEGGEREQIEEKEETEEKEVKEKLLEELAPAKSTLPMPSEDNKKSVEDEDYADVPSSEESEQETKQNGAKDAQVYRYRCRICSKQFKLLPDLGRHHQAEHMSAHVGTISKSRTGSSRKKRGKVSKEGMNSIRRIKKAFHSVQQQKNERPRDGPTDEEIFEAAQTTCCELGLQRDLEAKYTLVPEGLFAIVMRMGTERKAEVNWTKDGYVCPENCYMRNRKTGVNPLSRKKSVVICEDISFGKERTPVPCVEDEDNEPCNCMQCREGKSYHVDSLKPWETFSYITRRLLDPSLGLDTKDSQIGCSCTKGRCSPKSCDHVIMFDSDYAEACDIWGEEMQGRFPYDNEGRIILQEGYLVYECNSSCSCSHDCPNRVLQRGVSVKLEVFKTRHKGWAVRAAEFIPRGTFVCEYLGEVLNDQEANRRGERYDQVGCSYLYDIDVHLNPGGKRSRRTPRGAPKVKPFVIDASKHGNVSRFINHSCSPNLVNYQVLVESMDYQLAHIGLFASRDIQCGEELAYNYRYRMLPGKGCPCHCGAPGCRGRLY